jgi:hypothetical protein
VRERDRGAVGCGERGGVGCLCGWERDGVGRVKTLGVVYIEARQSIGNGLFRGLRCIFSEAGLISGPSPKMEVR